MNAIRSNGALAASLLAAIFLWGGNNVGVKHLVRFWPPIWTGSVRFLCAGCLMLALLRWTNWFGAPGAETARPGRSWWPGSLALAAYIIAFNVAMLFTTASNVALCLGAAPVWALLWEGKPARNWRSVQRFAAAGLALAGVVILFWPSLRFQQGRWVGDALALLSSILWTTYGRQCRLMGAAASGAAITAHTMWRAGLVTLPLGLVEFAFRPPVWQMDLAAIQGYGVVCGGVIAFALWNNALRHWPASQVFLFNNLIPLSTVAWAHFCIDEPITPTFWLAMLCIVGGVLLGQTRWEKIFGSRWFPAE